MRIEPKIGDKIKIGTGRQIWTIIHIKDDLRLGHFGHTFLTLINPQGTRHARCYLEEAKFVDEGIDIYA